MTRPVMPEYPDLTQQLVGLRFGNRRVTKMYAQINELRRAIAAEASPRIQSAWDKVEEHLDFAYQMAAQQLMFNVEDLRAAWDFSSGCDAPAELFWDVAVSALLDRAVTDAEVAMYRPLIRQAKGES